MNLLVDGHNLIGKMPDIDLEDPDDETKLVSCLRRFAARTTNKLVVFFDGGLPGGMSPELSGANIQVIFAPAGKSADPLIIKRIRSIRDRNAWMVVSSDRAILDAAAHQHMRVERAEEFVIKMTESLEPSRESVDSRQTSLSEEDVEAWMEIFSVKKRRR